MIRCLDIHTHHPAPQPLAVISDSIGNFQPIEGQFYSVGFHPWHTDKEIQENSWNELERVASLPCIVAIGECGIDKLQGGPLFRQLLVMKKQIDLSEKLEKPLVIHDVKAHDIIIGLKKEYKPKQQWMIHGFRGKPSVAKMMTDAGIYLSFGEKFNPVSLSLMPENMILAETDESSLTIEQIIANMSSIIGRNITELIAVNTTRFLFGEKYR